MPATTFQYPENNSTTLRQTTQAIRTTHIVPLSPAQIQLRKLSVWIATVEKVAIIGEVLQLNEMTFSDMYLKDWAPFAERVCNLKEGSLVIVNNTGAPLCLLKSMVAAAIEKSILVTAGRKCTLANVFVNKHLMALRNDNTYYESDKCLTTFYQSDKFMLDKYSKLMPNMG